MGRALFFVFIFVGASAAHADNAHTAAAGREDPASQVITDYPFAVDDYIDARDCKDYSDTQNFFKTVTDKDVLPACLSLKDAAQTAVNAALAACVAVNSAVKQLGIDAAAYNDKYADDTPEARQAPLTTLMNAVNQAQGLNDTAAAAETQADSAEKSLEQCQAAMPYPDCPDSSNGTDGIAKCSKSCGDTSSLNDVTGLCEPDCSGDNQIQFSDPSTGKVSCRTPCPDDQDMDAFGHCQPIAVKDAACTIGKGRHRRPGELFTLPNGKKRCLPPCKKNAFRSPNGRCVQSSRVPLARTPAPQPIACTLKKGKKQIPGELITLPSGRQRCVPPCRPGFVRADRGGCLKPRPGAEPKPVHPPVLRDSGHDEF